MLVAALIILNKELLTGMSLGDTANLGIVSLVFAFLATVAYAVAAAFIIKRALSTASRTAPEKVQAKSQTESKDEKKGADTEKTATPWHTVATDLQSQLDSNFLNLSYILFYRE